MSARRGFGTGSLTFTRIGRAHWVFDGVHRYEIERRRAEPGCPAGWYYFGPGTESGEYCGTAEGAAQLAESCWWDADVRRKHRCDRCRAWDFDNLTAREYVERYGSLALDVRED